MMYPLPREQQCPYCDSTVEPCHSVWDYEAEEEVECDMCSRTYVVKPQYQFEGFLIEKQCPKCEEWTEDGYPMCDCEEEEEGSV